MPNKQEYQRRKTLGLCSNCGSPAIVGKTLCSACAEKHAAKYRTKRKKGVCFNCGNEAAPNKTRCESCGERQKLLQQQKRKERKAKGECVRCGERSKRGRCENCLKQEKNLRDERKRAGLCRSCGKPPSEGKSRCAKCEQANKQSREKLKTQTFEAYGGALCACCEEDKIEFLTLDHMHNNGAEHRRQVSSSGVYRSLRQLGYPPGYQVLCMNCNWARYAYGMCPHQKENNDVAARLGEEKADPSARMVK